jgi:hypothetical protein
MPESACLIGGRYGARRRLLLPVDLGKPIGDVVMLWIEFAGLVKGSASFVKLPLRQARVSMHKSVVPEVLIGFPLRRDAQGMRLLPTPPGKPPYTHDNDQHHDHEAHSNPFRFFDSKIYSIVKSMAYKFTRLCLKAWCTEFYA